MTRAPMIPVGGRTAIRPTAFGVTAVLILIALFAARGTITDPDLAGLVYAVFVGLVVVGLVWPLVAIRLVRVAVAEAPRDGVVGRPARFTLVRAGPKLIDNVGVRIEGTVDDEVWSVAWGPSVVEVSSAFRGVYPSIEVFVDIDGPLGMLVAARTLTVPLPAPIAVGPAVVPRRWDATVAPETGTDEGPAPSSGGGDQVRSVRPYRSGDPAHLVHWPSSARLGSLVVRELEPPIRPGVVLVVDLGPARERLVDGPRRIDEVDPAVERAVAEAAGIAEGVLRSGGGVLLCTSEDGVPRSAEVTASLQLQRRLAAAGPGPVGRATGPGSWSTVTVTPHDGVDAGGGHRAGAGATA